MKRIILFMLVCIGMTCRMYGQNERHMQVVSFDKIDERTAQLKGTARLDNNNRNAALIKVNTYGKGYSFTNGTVGLVGDIVYREDGEIWVYVPRRSQKLTITHERFGRCEYEFEIPIDEGTVYRMKLDPGVGSFVNIRASQTGATVFVDGEAIGKTPLVNEYIMRGKHKVKVEKGRLVGEQDIEVGDDIAPDHYIELIDQSPHYARVTIKVDNDKEAEIWCDGENKGYGQWKTELYEGTYYIETRKDSCESRNTTIKVFGQKDSTYVVVPPEPFKGTMQLQVFPRKANITVNKTRYENATKIPVNVGKILVECTRKGYKDLEREYTLSKDQHISDTITMERISYIKSTQAYIGAGFSYNTLSGVTGLAGVTFKHFDLQLSYTIGLTSTDDVMWYSGNDYQNTINYKQSGFAAKLGYQIRASSRIAIVPQAGYLLMTLAATKTDGLQSTLYGDASKCSCLTFGAKVVFVPWKMVGIFINPEYAAAMKKDAYYEHIADALGLTAGGLYVHAGLVVKF